MHANEDINSTNKMADDYVSRRAKSAFITGGTGSFGRAFVARLLANPGCLERIVVFSRDELKQFEMREQLEGNTAVSVEFVIGDVRDSERLRHSMRGADFVVHAAALKQVPTTELNPFEAIKTNVLGAQNGIS
jgi:UDP-N-acetylglucosamine 4,6-dehydratase/5-epimerase